MPDNRNRKRPIQVKFFVDEREFGLIKARMAQLGIENMSLLFSVSHVSKRHFPNGNRRQPPPCLPKSEMDGQKSMAA